jgi:hypothetical protein
MKKTILSIGLFTLVLVSTSFASPKNLSTSIVEDRVITSIDGTGGQSNEGGKKVDGVFFINNVGSTLEVSTLDNRKAD